MKQSEFLKWLKAQGVETENGKKHLKLYFNGRISHLPRHSSQELTTGLVEKINSSPQIEGYHCTDKTRG